MRLLILCAVLGGTWLGPVCFSVGLAGDYFLTLGGGYSPQGNQASLEANVIFFQQVLVDRQLSGSPHRIYFADGFDAQHDLQVLRQEPVNSSSVMQQLSSIFRLDREELVYRNHEVPKISGGISNSEIQDGLESIRNQLRSGDRLFVYVTAHGGSARKGELQDTSISAGGISRLRSAKFSSWLDEFPAGVTIVSVMAQCYCGGFAQYDFSSWQSRARFRGQYPLWFLRNSPTCQRRAADPTLRMMRSTAATFGGPFWDDRVPGRRPGP